jgi:hypothetical protein
MLGVGRARVKSVACGVIGLGTIVDVNLLNGAWWAGGGVQGRYGDVGISMRGMARLRKVAASSWAGVSCARVSWARMLFSARVDGIEPSSSSADLGIYHIYTIQ